MADDMDQAGPSRAGAPQTLDDLLDQYGPTLKKLRKGAENDPARHAYTQVCERVEKYAYDLEAMNEAVSEKLKVDDEGSPFVIPFKPEMNRAAEFVDIVGPHLHPESPVATVQSADHATFWQRERHRIEEKYLNLAIRKGGMLPELIDAINHACNAGRGVLWHGYDVERDVVVHQFGSSTDLLIDPDASGLHKANFIKRRRFLPRWQLMAMFAGNARAEKLLQSEEIKACERPSTSFSRREKNRDKIQRADIGRLNDLIEFYDCYYRVSLSEYSEGAAEYVGADGQPAALDGATRYVMAGDRILSADPWEIPYWRVGLWPMEVLDLLPTPGCLWPRSPIQAGLGNLELMNLIYQLYIAKIAVATQLPIAVMNFNGSGVKDEDLVKVMQSKFFSTVKVQLNGNDFVPIEQLLKKMELNTGAPELIQLAEYVDRQWQKSSGLDELMYSGQGSTQSRTAADSELRAARSMHRVSGYQNRVGDFTSRVIAKTAIAARYLHPPEDIAKKFGPTAGAVWGMLAPPEQVEQEQAQRMQQALALKAQAQAMQQQMLAMAPPGAPLPPGPSDEDIDQQMGPPKFVSFDDWLNEADRQVEAGSMRRIDHGAQTENLNIFFQTIVPVLAPNPAAAPLIAAAAEEFTRHHRFPIGLQLAASEFKSKVETAALLPPMPPDPGNGDGHNAKRGEPKERTPTGGDPR